MTYIYIDFSEHHHANKTYTHKIYKQRYTVLSRKNALKALRIRAQVHRNVQAHRFTPNFLNRFQFIFQSIFSYTLFSVFTGLKLVVLSCKRIPTWSRYSNFSYVMGCQIFWLRLQHLEVLVPAPEKFGPKNQKKVFV